MPYFKHSELVDRYKVSLKTVHNWIEGARQGKIDLQLHEKGDRTYIANTAGNLTSLELLSEQGKKYRNSRHRKVVEPTDAFYELYSPKQIYDIISNLKIHHEIPMQYNYFDGGATNWDRFARRLWREENPSLLKRTVDLLNANLNSLEQLTRGYKKINIIDIGPGNALPVKDLLSHFTEQGVLNRYIALDVSEAMLHIAKDNIHSWFGNTVRIEGYVRDITHERFDDLLARDMLSHEANRTINIVLFLGATPMNFREPYDCLKVIYNSMGQDDILVYTDKPDTEADRMYFDFSPEPSTNTLSPNQRLIVDLLSIDESLYDVEMGFNVQKRVRYIKAKLRVALTIKFRSKDIEQDIDLDKGDAILLLRATHQTTLEVISGFEKAGFALLQASITKDQQYLLTISGVSVTTELKP